MCGAFFKPSYPFFPILAVCVLLGPMWADQKPISQQISFENVVCDLGEVGLGTKNGCEFKFKNTGRGALEITNVKPACGCTVFKLDKRKYAPGESGTIKVTYAAPTTATTATKHIYVQSNDKANPPVRLPVKARFF